MPRRSARCRRYALLPYQRDFAMLKACHIRATRYDTLRFRR